MINKIVVENFASYKNKVEIIPNQINYVYGSNGSGKSTLAQLMATDSSDSINMSWDSTSKDKIFVYNKQFIKSAFGGGNLNGIFTLGEESKDIDEKINNLDVQINEYGAQKGRGEGSLNHKEQELQILATDLTKACWNVYLKYKESFEMYFSGYKSSKDKFRAQCENLYSKTICNEVEIDILKKEYDILNNQDLCQYEKYELFDFDRIECILNDDIWKSKVEILSEGNISKYVKENDIADWVNSGIDKINNNICPFCQQYIADELVEDLKNIFDENYKLKINKMQLLQREFYDLGKRLFEYIDAITKTEYAILSYEVILQIKEKIKGKFNAAYALMRDKIKEPSILIEFEYKKAISELEANVKEFNALIKDNNKKFQRKKELNDSNKNKFWNYIVNYELHSAIGLYLSKSKNISEAIKGISTSIKAAKEKLSDAKEKKRALLESKTNVIKTKNDINAILSSYGITSFKIDVTADGKSYVMIRDDGKMVEKNLSEGEYTFITFLYFYNLIKGQTDQSEDIQDKVVVIDDPISSLDSNILFVVSSLVKEIVRMGIADTHGVKQVFILTHNLYFYKEITFSGGRQEKGPGKKSYMIISKIDGATQARSYPTNQIKSSYELLWRNAMDENIGNISQYNSMRRILEYYFKICGGVDYEKLVNEFEGNNRLACKSLLSCVNDSSHEVEIDFYYSANPEIHGIYKNIFKSIFEFSGQISHYDMMMSDKNE